MFQGEGGTWHDDHGQSGVNLMAGEAPRGEQEGMALPHKDVTRGRGSSLRTAREQTAELRTARDVRR